MHKSLEWKEGENAYAEGNSRATCPYRANGTEPDADKYEQWMDGYQAAEDLDDQE